jgi:uncharacterized membrane protein YidH (DUF202 family)
MTTNRVTYGLSQSESPRVNVLGILFFLLGTPHLYEAFKRQRKSPRPFSFNITSYGAVMLMAAIVAALVECSVFF